MSRDERRGLCIIVVIIFSRPQTKIIGELVSGYVSALKKCGKLAENCK